MLAEPDDKEKTPKQDLKARGGLKRQSILRQSDQAD
jgi:hypothetical protein